MHIAIEGFDGVGKTETAKELARRLEFTFVEKPLHYIIDEEGMTNYLRITNLINAKMDSNFTALFYGLGNYYTGKILKEKYTNIVTDRHLCSTYFWNGNEANEVFFNFIVNISGVPDLTIILYADAEIRRARITKRNINDPDLKKTILPNESYEKMKNFVKKYNMNYQIIDNSIMTLDETVDKILTFL